MRSFTKPFRVLRAYVGTDLCFGDDFFLQVPEGECLKEEMETRKVFDEMTSTCKAFSMSVSISASENGVVGYFFFAEAFVTMGVISSSFYLVVKTSCDDVKPAASFLPTCILSSKDASSVENLFMMVWKENWRSALLASISPKLTDFFSSSTVKFS